MIQSGSAFLRGLKASWPETAFRQEFFIALALLPVPWWCNTTSTEKLMLYSAVVWVLVCEIINTALESFVNLLQPEFHPTAGAAKDLGSAAVAGADFIFLCVWTGILWQ